MVLVDSAVPEEQREVLVQREVLELQVSLVPRPLSRPSPVSPSSLLGRLVVVEVP